MISLLQWRSWNNRYRRWNKPSTQKKLLAKQRLNSLLSKLSNKALQSESGTFLGTSLPLAPPSIPSPPCTRQDYEIKLALIGLVQEKMLNGLAAEIPLDHIENFERVCNFSRTNGVPPDYIKCNSLASLSPDWYTYYMGTSQSSVLKPFLHEDENRSSEA